jgi:hypothetical protein
MKNKQKEWHTATKPLTIQMKTKLNPPLENGVLKVLNLVCLHSRNLPLQENGEIVQESSFKLPLFFCYIQYVLGQGC